MQMDDDVWELPAVASGKFVLIADIVVDAESNLCSIGAKWRSHAAAMVTIDVHGRMVCAR